MESRAYKEIGNDDWATEFLGDMTDVIDILILLARVCVGNEKDGYWLISCMKLKLLCTIFESEFLLYLNTQYRRHCGCQLFD